MIYTEQQLKNPIRIPSGVCPVKLGSFCDFASVGCQPSPIIIIAWFWEVRNFGLRRGEFLTAEAIAYYARYEFSPSYETRDDYYEIESTIYDYAREIGDPFGPEPGKSLQTNPDA